jgi:hypothetical protein
VPATELLEDATLDEMLLTKELLLEIAAALDELLGVLEVLPSIPKGEGCDVHVLREIQLALFSQPQPLVVVTHSG